jgi:bacterial/archaeal transporter family protein
MTPATGIAFAFVAMLCWGIGDFLIQRSTRKVGDFETLFLISLFGMVVLFPFVLGDVETLISNGRTVLILALCSTVLLVAALLDFEALRVGKLSIVEPIWSLEIPVAAVMAYLFLGERLGVVQIVLIIILIAGLVLVSVRGRHSLRHVFERGALIALIAAIAMGAANFLFGWGGRLSSPIMVNFFVSVFLAGATGAVLFIRGRLMVALSDFVRYRHLLVPMSIFDKAAWVAFAAAMVAAPIGIVVALSESYIIIAVLLGLFINRERLRPHQYAGLLVALGSAITLAAVTV